MLKNTFIVGTIVEAKVFKKAKKPANWQASISSCQFFAKTNSRFYVRSSGIRNL